MDEEPVERRVFEGVVKVTEQEMFSLLSEPYDRDKAWGACDALNEWEGRRVRVTIELME